VPSSRVLPAPPLAPNRGSIASGTAPRIAWTYVAGGFVRGIRYAEGRTYVITLADLTALDAATGRRLWQIPLASVDTALGDATADGVFYIAGSRVVGETQGVMAIDCATGRVHWTYTVASGVVPNGVSAPLEGAVYATVYNHGSNQREVWAIDSSTQKVRWKSPCAFQNDSAYTYAPAGGSRVFNCDSQGGAMTVFDAASGQVAWSTADDCSFGYPGPVGDTLIAVGSTAVRGLDPKTGTTLWQATAPLQGPGSGGFTDLGSDASGASITQVFAQDSDSYYVWNGTNIAAYRAGASGSDVWAAALNRGGLALNIDVTFDGNDTMFISGGSLFAVDTRTGGCRWQYSPYAAAGLASADVFDSPIAAGGGYCFIAASDTPTGKVVALAVD